MVQLFKQQSFQGEVKQFTSTNDNQKVVTVRIFDDARPLIKDKQLLGEFDLTRLPPASRGEAKIDVTFDIDLNGILTVIILFYRHQLISSLFLVTAQEKSPFL